IKVDPSGTTRPSLMCSHGNFVKALDSAVQAVQELIKPEIADDLGYSAILKTHPAPPEVGIVVAVTVLPHDCARSSAPPIRHRAGKWNSRDLHRDLIFTGQLRRQTDSLRLEPPGKTQAQFARRDPGRRCTGSRGRRVERKPASHAIQRREKSLAPLRPVPADR